MSDPPVLAGRLIIVCGLPGSGKTTTARRLEDKLEAIRLCPDDWMEALAIDIFDELWERVRVRDPECHLGHRALARSDLEDYATAFHRPDAAEVALYDPPI